MRLQLRMGVTGEENYDKFLSRLLFVYCMLLPLEEAFAFSFGSILRLWGIIIIGYCFSVHLRSKIKLRELRLLFPFIVWIVFLGLSIIWSTDYSWWIYFIKIYVFQVFFVLVVLSYQRFVDLSYIKNGLIAGAMIATGILIFFPGASLLTEDGRRTIIIFGNEFDPNIVASIIMIALLIMVDRFFNQKSTSCVLRILFLAVGLLFTGSRGALISTVAGFGAYLLLQMKNRGNRRRVLLLVSLGILAAIVTLIVLPSELFLSRFTFDSLFGLDEYRAGAHNRWTIWKYALSLVPKAPLLGYGCGNFFSAIATVYRRCASHNLYILILVENGLIGLLVFSTGLYRIFKAALRRKNYAILALLVSVSVMALTLDSLTCKFYWVIIILSILSIMQHKKVDC